MFEDEEAVYGAEQIPVPGRTFNGLVDSGASFCALETALGQYMTKVERGWTAVKDYKGESTKMAHRRGQVCVCVYDEDQHGFFTIDGKALEGVKESLISSSYMVERLGPCS